MCIELRDTNKNRPALGHGGFIREATLSDPLWIFFALAKSNSITQKGKISLSNSHQQLIPLSNDLVHNKYSFKVSNEYDIPDKVILKEKINGATIPPIFFAGLLYFGSMWKTVIDIDNSNRKLVKRFSNRVTSKLPVENFMDYQTPDFILK